MKHVKPYSRWRLASTSCAIALLAVVAVVPWRVVAQEAPPEPGSTSLAEAVKQFNAEAAINKHGKDQPALTEDEVVAAIRWTVNGKPFADATPAEYAALLKVADTKRLPKDARLEVQTGFHPGDELLYTIWSVRLQIPRGQPYLTYGFPIRDRYVTVERSDPYQSDSPPSRRRFSNSLRPTPEKIDESLPTLADAIKKFNAEAAEHPISKNQPPLTEDEVVAALFWNDLKLYEVHKNGKQYAVLEEVAKTRRLPKGAEFYVDCVFKPGDGYQYDKWTVRLLLPPKKEGATTPAPLIREQFLNVRPTDPEETDSPRAKVSTTAPLKIGPKLVNSALQVAGAPAPNPKTAENDSHSAASRRAVQAATAPAEPSMPKKSGKSQAEIEKLLVGIWRDAEKNEVQFFDDGSYEDFNVAIFGREINPPPSEPPGPRHEYESSQGSWSMSDDQLHLQKDRPTDFWMPRAPRADAKQSNSTSRLQVLRIDGDHLRIRTLWKGNNMGTTFFLRRVADKNNDELYAAIPAELRAMADAANLTPLEATEVSDWLKTRSVELKSLKILDQVQQVRRRKLTLAEFFNMSPTEVTTFHELLQQANVPHWRWQQLAAADQLTTAEKEAFEKVDKGFVTLNALNIQTRVAEEHAIADGQTVPRNAAKRKFHKKIDELQQWLINTTRSLP